MSPTHADGLQSTDTGGVGSSPPHAGMADWIGDTADALLVMNRLAGVRILIDYYAGTGILRRSRGPAYELADAERDQVARALLTESSSEASAAELTSALLILLRSSSYTGSSAVVHTFVATIHRQMQIEKRHTDASLRRVEASPHWPAVTR